MSAPAESLLQTLNPAQREAVLAREGPVLVVAGPGTGKTHTLTVRLAYLIQAHAVPAASLLAMTFTKRAAQEMAARLQRWVGAAARDVSLGTFHGFCFKLLQAEAERHGLPPGFGVCGPRDQVAHMQRCLRQLGREDGVATAQAVLAELSRARNEAIPEAGLGETGLSDVYRAYQARLRRHGLVDFDDLIVLAVALLDAFPEVRARLQSRYRYLSVDEYQDVNPLQYRLLRLIAGERPNLWAVGDADQAIYAFRGAQVENFLRFEQDFPGSRIIRLEQSYRSTPQIVTAAAQVIARNTNRLPYTLSTHNAGGPAIRVVSLPDEAAEAAWLVREIEERVGGTSHYQHYKGQVADAVSRRAQSFRDLAVLVRLNALARPIEDALARAGIPYRVVGGTRFYDRTAVRDVLAYLRALRQPQDSESLGRILNTPPRGIGRETQAALATQAEQQARSLYTLIEEQALSNRRLQEFLHLWRMLQAGMAERPLAQFLAELLDTTGLQRWHVAQDERRENDFLKLAMIVAQYDDLPTRQALDRLLAEAALAAESDDYDAGADAVTVMTLHAAKGLEFTEVFLCGLEEDILPAAGADLEEERRLFYVGLTRAQQSLHLLACRRRMLYGERRCRAASRFVEEFEKSLRETIVVPDPAKADPTAESEQLSLL